MKRGCFLCFLPLFLIIILIRLSIYMIACVILITLSDRADHQSLLQFSNLHFSSKGSKVHPFVGTYISLKR